MGGYKIGVDLGGTRIKIGLVKNGEVISVNILKSNPKIGLKANLPLIEEKILDLISKDDNSNVDGIGVAFPGLVNTKENIVIGTSSKYDDAPSLDLVSWAKQMFGIPLKLENDARLACLGEWRHGAGKGTSSMVLITLGTGIGTAAIVEGQLLRGGHFQAGILGGHFIIEYKENSHLCSCGRYGCAEAAASTWMIPKLAKENPLFAKSRLLEADVLDWKAIIEYSTKNDELALILKEHCLNVWAVTLVNLVHAYDPQFIVVGGGIVHSGPEILDYFRSVLRKRAWCPSGVPEIKQAQFPDTAALLGAAELFN